MSPGRRRKIVDREHPSLPIVRQCALLGVSRSSLYHRAKEASEADLCLMGGDGPAGPGDPILRVQADEGLAGEAGDTGKPEAGAAVDAQSWGFGPSTGVPAAADQRQRRASMLTVSGIHQVQHQLHKPGFALPLVRILDNRPAGYVVMEWRHIQSIYGSFKVFCGDRRRQQVRPVVLGFMISMDKRLPRDCNVHISGERQ